MNKISSEKSSQRHTWEGCGEVKWWLESTGFECIEHLEGPFSGTKKEEIASVSQTEL